MNIDTNKERCTDQIINNYMMLKLVFDKMECIKISLPFFRLEYINVDAVKQSMRIKG